MMNNKKKSATAKGTGASKGRPAAAPKTKAMASGKKKNTAIRSFGSNIGP